MGLARSGRCLFHDRRQYRYLIFRRFARLLYAYYLRADHRGRPVPPSVRLERRLVELRVAEGGEGRGPALHGRDEALLAHNGVPTSPEPGFSDKSRGSSPTRATPRRVFWMRKLVTDRSTPPPLFLHEPG